MHESTEIERPGDDVRSPGRVCPDWCVARHGTQLGEEAWVHVGEPLTVTEGVTAQLCASVDPDCGEADGPSVLIGVSASTPAEAAELGRALVELAASCASVAHGAQRQP